MTETFILCLLVGLDIIYKAWADREQSKMKTPLSSVEWHMFKDRDFIALLKELKKLINENHNDTRNTIRDATNRAKKEIIEEFGQRVGSSDTDKSSTDGKDV